MPATDPINAGGGVNTPSSINPASPIDSIAAMLMLEARRINRGFVLGLTQDAGEDGKPGPLSVEVKQTLAPHDDYEKPVGWRNHNLQDVAGVIAMAKKYGSKDKSLILYTDTQVELVLDEKQNGDGRGEREILLMAFAYSAEWRAWEAMVNGALLDHRKLLEFLLVNQHTVADPAVIDKMREVKASFVADYQSDLRLNRETVGVVFKATGGEELVNFPRAFKIDLPVLDIDVGQKNQLVNLRLEVKLPTQPQQPVLFQLLAPEWAAIRRTRINAELETLRAALAEWTVVRGEHVEAERVVGR